jgi:hypothetical protein
MRTPVKARLITAVMLAGLLASTLLGAHPAGAQPDGQTDLLSVIQQWVTASNAGDTATLATILASSYQGITTNMPPNAPPQLRQPTNRDAELQDAGQPEVHVTASHCAQTSANTVQCDIGVSGGPSGHLPHPWTATAVFTFAEGKIVRYVQTLSETTRNDLAQIFANVQPPQRMPATGRPDGAPGSASLFFLLACAGLLFAAGGAVRRRRGDSRP